MTHPLSSRIRTSRTTTSRPSSQSSTLFLMMPAATGGAGPRRPPGTWGGEPQKAVDDTTTTTTAATTNKAAHHQRQHPPRYAVVVVGPRQRRQHTPKRETEDPTPPSSFSQSYDEPSGGRRYHPHPQGAPGGGSTNFRIVSPVIMNPHQASPPPPPPRNSTYHHPAASPSPPSSSSAMTSMMRIPSNSRGGGVVSSGGEGPNPAAAASSLSLTTKDSTQSLSAGSTASIDSFVNLFLMDDEGLVVTRGMPNSHNMINHDDSNSSSFSFDPYLSRRRKPSWAAAATSSGGAAAITTTTTTTTRVGDMRRLYVPPTQRQGATQQRRRDRHAIDNADNDDQSSDFVQRQRDIALQLEQLSVSHDDEVELQLQHEHGLGDGNRRRATTGHDGSGSYEDNDEDFPNGPLHSSFFTSESLARYGRDDDENENDYDDNDTLDDDATDEQGFPRHLSSIPTPTMTKMLLANRHRSLLDGTGSVSVASLVASTVDNDDNHNVSKASSYSSAKTADAGIHSLPSSKAVDSERDRRAIQTVLYWRHIVSLRGSTAPRWITASTLHATAGNSRTASRRTNRPSLAMARAHLQLGNALLAIQEYSEACKSFQTSYRIFGVQPNAAQRHVLSMALCMERMGVATALATDPVHVSVPESPSSRQQRQIPRTINDHVQADPTFAMLVRAYTVQLESFRLRTLHLGSHHVDVISGLNHVAQLHCHNRDWVSALQCLWQVYWARTVVFGSVHPSCGVAAHDVANVFAQLQMWDDAVNFYSIARHVYDTLNVPDHNPALKKLNRDVRRLERLEHRQGFNVL